MATLLTPLARRARWSIPKRYYSTVAQASNNSEASATKSEEPKIPMVPKNRDPMAVLKALASTVEPTEHEIVDGMGPADPMYPMSEADRLMYVKHLEAGRKAADYVVGRWPKLFKLKKLDSEPLEEPKKDLQYYISKHKAGKVMKKYNELIEKGESVPLETKNEVLALAAFFGLQSPYVTGADKRMIYEEHKDFTWWTGTRKSGATQKVEVAKVSSTGETLKEGASEGEVVKDKAQMSMKPITGGVRIWSMDNLAERLFKDFEEKNEKTYEAMIQGLVKYKYYKRAFQLFDEMRSLNYQAQTSTYNLLFSAMTDRTLIGPSMWTPAKALLSHMNSDPKVMPNTETFNHLLRISSCNESTAHSMSLKILREMLYLGIEPSLGTFYIVLESFKNRGENHWIVEEMIEYLEKNPSIIRLQSMDCNKFFSAAMYACVIVPGSEAGKKLLHLYLDHGNSGLLDCRQFFWNDYMRVIFKESLDKIMAEYKRLVPNIFLPHEKIYKQLIILISKEGNLDLLEIIWNDIRKYNVMVQDWYIAESIVNLFESSSIPHEEVHKYMMILDEAVHKLLDADQNPPRRVLVYLIQLAFISQNADKAWEYYKIFGDIYDGLPFTSMKQLLLCQDQPQHKERVLHLLDRMVAMKMTLREQQVVGVCRNTQIDSSVCYSFVEKLSVNINMPEKKKTSDTVEEKMQTEKELHIWELKRKDDKTDVKYATKEEIAGEHADVKETDQRTNSTDAGVDAAVLESEVVSDEFVNVESGTIVSGRSEGKEQLHGSTDPFDGVKDEVEVDKKNES